MLYAFLIFFGGKTRAIIKGVTKVFKDRDIPTHSVEVIVNEIPISYWGLEGIPASENFKDIF